MGSNTDHRQIHLVRLAYVHYTHKDITKASQFLNDFGLQEVKTIDKDNKTTYYRGTGPEPFIYCVRQGDVDEFGGAAFVVESREDLEYASQTLPRASKVYELLEAPGGGLCVTFWDPVDGFPFHLIYGQDLAGETKTLPQLKYNYPTEKHRSTNTAQRFQPGPAPVHKLGHFGMCVTDFDKAY